MRRLAVIGTLVAAALAFPSAALAHGIVGRTDLPIPVWLFGWAAAVVLIVSFVALGSLWPTPRWQVERIGRPLVRLPVLVDVVLGALGVALFGLTVYAGLAGVDDAFGNLAPTMVYVLFWVGMVVQSVLFGNVFRLLSPWRATARAVSWTARKVSGREAPPVVAYPAWLGRWPAAIGIFAFAFVELAYRNRDDPTQLAIMALVYAVAMLAGMAWFGIETWSERADPFGVYFGLFARLSPFTRRDGVLRLRPPLAGAPSLDIVPGTVALLTVAIGSTTFDGFSNGPVWGSIAPHIESLFGHLGGGPQAQLQWASLIGLIACVLLVSGFYRLGIGGMVTVGEGHDAKELAGLFAHTLIPIAFAYALAHYFSLLVYQGQGAIHLFSDPLGHGSDLFGTAGVGINYGVISSKGIWYVQVGALVAGHVAGLTLAHDRAVGMYRQVQDALRSQYWMLVVMVGFTSLGLWLLSAVNT
ncbi:MAG: fenitrothion hydrolase [Thermoleophilaceae bacterium]